MPQFLPFRGLRYTASAGPLSELLAPPYDVITPAQQQALAARNPHNAVHLELAEGGEDRYRRVAGLLAEWLRDGTVRRDSSPMLYVYEQEFIEEGHVFMRRALIAAVEAQPWDEGAVKPHEYTMSGPKEDRLKLLQATGVQFSPVFMIARDRAGRLAAFLHSAIVSRPPDATATTIDGDHHRFWAIEAGTFEMRQVAPLLGESFYIADGHHRYETAVSYRDWRAGQEELPRDHPARFAMTAIVAASDPGLVIRPIHRMVPRTAPADWRERLGGAFAVTHVKLVGNAGERAAELAALLAGAPCNIVALGLEPGQVHLLCRQGGARLAGNVPAGRSEAWASIAPNVLRYGVLEPLWDISDDDLRAGVVEYSHDTQEVLEFLDAHPGSTAFLLNPVTIDSVMALADQGERMPQKSTFFHPKLGTGLVFHPLNP
ncbi:MAG TPA: DUF1015 domain-containing protein [Tepidiformaceae bacterium]|nr:DUF1015 domain-containing protein [Tepidiformaceae bacterium]